MLGDGSSVVRYLIWQNQLSKDLLHLLLASVSPTLLLLVPWDRCLKRRYACVEGACKVSWPSRSVSAFASGCNATLLYIFVFRVLSFSFPSFFSSSALPCETVVRTLEELPCTSVHVLDVRVMCHVRTAGNASRCLVRCKGHHRKMMGGSLCSISVFCSHLLACFHYLRVCRYTDDAVVCPDVHMIEPDALI